MSLLDPATGRPLPADAIQRVLYICHPVHVYAIPPLMSMKGYTAADWTTPDPHNNGKTKEIFTARLRILETAIPNPTPANPRIRPSPLPGRSSAAQDAAQEKVKVDILLEDASTGGLFAAAPYSDAGVVDHTVDSSRFFALRVVGEGRKAMLGIGFEDRSDAFDFGVALQEARKVLGFPTAAAGSPGGNEVAQKVPPMAQAGAGRRLGIGTSQRGRMAPGTRSPAPQQQQQQRREPPQQPVDNKPKDYSLKPGQTITVNLGSRQGANTAPESSKAPESAAEDQKALFSIAPPPAASQSGSSPEAAFSLPPPPSAAKDARGDRRRRPAPTSEASVAEPVGPKVSNKEPGFEDDEFGDFQ